MIVTGARPGFTEDQRAAIDAGVGSLIVTANAGSGKTSILVERFVQAVVRDGIEVDAILAITFTEKAAGHLRERIRARFIELGEVRRAQEVADAHISTIHGFCAAALRAQALSAGIDPSFAILDDVRSQRLTGEAFDAALERVLAIQGDAALDVLADYQVPAMRRAIDDLHARLRSRGHAAPELPPAPAVEDVEGLRSELAAAGRAAAAKLGKGRLELKSVGDALAALERCHDLLARADPEDPLLAGLDSVVLANGGVPELEDEECAGYRRALKAYRQALVNRRAGPVYGVVAALLCAFTDRYAELKRTRGWLDFDDLELCFGELLRSRPGVADRYARRFALVMVDEFQDVNAQQLAIVDAIARDNLFLVGDELQSIYAFRHADVQLFRTRRAELRRVGAARSLQTNFRSHEQILDALNAGIGKRLGPDFLPLLAGRAVDPDGAAPLVEVLVTEQRAWEDRGPDAPDLGEAPPGARRWRLAEARLLAQHVHELVQGTRYCYRDVVVLLRATGDMGVFERALEDQGVPTYLVGGRGYWRHPQVRDLVAWLAVLANPQDTLALYGVLASPLVGCSSDGLVVLAAAAERMGATAWSTLREAVAPGSSDGLLDRLDGSDRAALTTFVRRAVHERSHMAQLPIDELIERAVTETGYDLAVLAMPGGQRRMANVRKLMRLAREHEPEEGRDLRAFLSLVDQLADDWWGAPSEGEAPVQSESEGPVEASALDAVRIMTIHRSKGLEFPVVYVADLGRAPPSVGDVIALGEDGRVGVRLRTAEGGGDDAFDYRDLVDERKQRDFDEEQRLFYVAMTRAQERLVLSGSIRRMDKWPELKPGCPPLSWIAPALVPEIAERLSAESPVLLDECRLEYRGRAVAVGCRLNIPATIGAVLAERSLAPLPTPEVEQPAENLPPAPAAPPPAPPTALVGRLSYSALAEYARCGYRFYLQRALGLPTREPSGGPGHDVAAPALLRGTVVHELLERLDLATPATPSLAEVRALAASHGGGLDDETASEVIALVEAFARSALRARLAAAAEVRREAAFAFSLPAGEAQPLLITGVVDAMTTTGADALVVDYKSDRLSGQAPAEIVARAYGTQRLVYALAALRAGAEHVEVVHCFLERPDEPVVAQFSRGDAPALETALAALAAGVVDECFEVSGRPNRELCTGCPGRGTLCSWPLEATLADPPGELSR